MKNLLPTGQLVSWSRWSRWCGSVAGGAQGTPGAIDVGPGPALCLMFDAAEPPPRLQGVARLEIEVDPRRCLQPWSRVDVPTHVVVNTLGGARLGALLGATLRGGRTFHMVVAPGATLTVNARGALALALVRGVQRGLSALKEEPSLLGWRLDWPRPSLGATIELAGGLAALPQVVVDQLRSVVHVTGRLGPGGAERQLVQAAVAARDAGLSVDVVSLTPLQGEDSQHVRTLQAAGVAVSSIRPLPPWRSGALAGPWAALVDRHASRELLIPLAQQLAARRPEVVHGWLDEPGLLAGLAGLLAGVPRVVIGLRNANPSRIPRFDRQWFRDTLRLLAHSPRVTLTANASAVASDYARWARLDPNSIQVVPNGLDVERLVPVVDPQERSCARQRLGLPPAAFLVGGVFRLAAMKRPGDWLGALGLAARRIPGLHAVHVGTGELEPSIREEVRRLGLNGRVSFLGHREAPEEVLRVCDASLLASEAEGLPNVVLESQALRVPPVVTDDGGTREALLPGETGFLVALGDLEGLASALTRLAEDSHRRAAMGAAGRAHVLARFGLRAAADLTLGLYAPPHPRR